MLQCGPRGVVSPGSTWGGRDAPERFIPATGTISQTRDDRLPELRGRFERILCIARSSGGRTVGNIELAGRLIRAVETWQGEVGE
jgi:hypothetical protein